MAANIKIRVQSEPFDLGKEVAALQSGSTSIGAVTSFTGYCRDENGRLAALELEHFPGMAQSQLETIAAQAGERWNLMGLTIIHRYGRLIPGEAIVLVAAAAAHRRAAFEAADFVMDYLKESAPFWKKEHPADPAQEPRWVEAKASDAADAARWRKS